MTRNHFLLASLIAALCPSATFARTALKRQIDTRLEAVGYADTTAYLSDLVEDAVADRQLVLAALEEGEAGGASAMSPEDILEDLLRKRLAA